MKYEMIGILPECFWSDVDFLLQKFLHVFFSEMSKETQEIGFWENCWGILGIFNLHLNNGVCFYIVGRQEVEPHCGAYF